MKNFADKVNAFNKSLLFEGALPAGITTMNPFKEDKNIITTSSAFYNKYYSDNNARHLILGINPGRFGAGITGIPFTDPKRLIEKCGLLYNGESAHEPSSVFVYEVIDAFGGTEAFYKKFYINSICPLGFTSISKKNKIVNYNYYDSKALTRAVYDFINQSIQQQLAFGIKTDTVFCFGMGKNEKFLLALNNEKKYFNKIVALPHPRYIMQYKSKSKQAYIDLYLAAFSQVK